MAERIKIKTPQEELLRYIRLLVEKRHRFIIISVCIMSIIIWGSYFIPRKYEAKSVIFIERNVIEELVKGIAITPSMAARISVLRDTMLGRSLIQSVLRKLDLASVAKNDTELEHMIVGFQKRTAIKDRDNLITISFIDKDPQLAKNYINTLVDEYVEKNIFAKREEAYDASKFLNRQVNFFKEKMDKGDEAIVKFRQEQGIYVAMDEGAIIKEIREHKGEIERLKIRENELTATKQSIEKQFEKEAPFTVTMFNSRDVARTIESLENRVRQLLISYTDNYPEVIKLRAEIETLKNPGTDQQSSVGQSDSEVSAINPVYQELKQRLMEIDTEIEAVKAKEKYMRALIDKKEEDLKNVPEDRKKLADLEQERDSYRSVYEQLLGRLGQSEVSKQMEIEDKATTFRIIEPAVLPKIPISPDRKILILAGILFGFLGGFGIIFLLDNIDDSVKNVDALKSLGMPILAIIPYIQSSEDRIRSRKKDLLIFGLTGLYMISILGVLAMEYLGLPYVDNFFSNVLLRKSL